MNKIRIDFFFFEFPEFPNILNNYNKLMNDSYFFLQIPRNLYGSKHN